MLGRIITKQQRLVHINNYKRKYPETANNQPHLELLGDIATVETNRVHNPITGYHEFAKDTPAWVVEIAKKHGWITTIGCLKGRR